MKRQTFRKTRSPKSQPNREEQMRGKYSVRRPILALAVVSVLTVIVVRIVVSAASPQEQTTTAEAQAPVANPDPPGTIDGAKNPELIPDEVALRMIVLAVAEPADATEEQKERARAKLNPIGLSEEDAIAFLNLLAEFRTQTDTVDRQIAEVRARAPIPHPASTDYNQLVELGALKRQLVTNTVAALPAQVSQDGLLKLSAYLPEAKKGMKIVPYGVSAR